MAERKRAAADDFYAINQHGTVVHVGAAEFTARYEPAGYRRMKADEVAPPQAHEVAKLNTDNPATIHTARIEQHGHARHPLPEDHPA